MRLARGLASPPASLLAGWLHTVAMADPFTGQPHGWLQVLSLAALVWQLVALAAGQGTHGGAEGSARTRTWPRAVWLGSWLGLGWLTGTVWWRFISMHTYGGLNAALAVAAVVALAGFLSIYYALACAAFVMLVPGRSARQRPVIAALVFAALWTLAELARGSWFTGFPWGAGGYAHVDGVLTFLARYGGVYGLGFVAAALAALLALFADVRWRQARTMAGAAAVVLVAGGLWAWRSHDLSEHESAGRSALTMEVALMQGNIPQDEKFVPGRGIVDSLRWYGEQLEANTATLIVGPETALPLLPRQLPEGYWEALAQRYQTPGQAALLGIPLGDMETGYTNSVIGLAPGQSATYRYDKHHLVPFGEFIPPFFKWFTEMMNIPLGDFARGGVGQPSFVWQNQRLAPNICYEDLFGEELAARFASPSAAPTAFVNLSNIAWFGDSVAIDQHLLISRMRALEFERPMLRATNTGATAIINHRGEVTHLQPRLTRGVLHGSFEGRTHITPFARWAAVAGQGPLGVVCGLLAGALGWYLRRRRG